MRKKIFLSIFVISLIASCNHSEDKSQEQVSAKQEISEEENEQMMLEEYNPEYRPEIVENKFLKLSVRLSSLTPVDTFASCISYVKIIGGTPEQIKKIGVLLRTNNSESGIDKVKHVYPLKYIDGLIATDKWISVAEYDILAFLPGKDTLKLTTPFGAGSYYTIEVEILK